MLYFLWLIYISTVLTWLLKLFIVILTFGFRDEGLFFVLFQAKVLNHVEFFCFMRDFFFNSDQFHLTKKLT